MGLLSNRIERSSLKPGDHIYSWRTAYIYAHHGIYVGDDKVIHFTRRGQEVGTGTMLDVLLARGGTCTLAVSDPDDDVIHRSKYLLDNGFGCYNVFKNNCEDFAIYCKMGLLVLDQSTMGQSGQAVSIIGGPLAAVLSTPLRLVTTNIYGMAATAVGVYCASRYAADIGMRRDVVKVPVEDLTRRLATGMLQVLEPSLPAAPALAH